MPERKQGESQKGKHKGQRTDVQPSMSSEATETIITENTESLQESMQRDDEDLSNFLFEILDYIGANKEHRKSCKRLGTTKSIMITYTAGHIATYYEVGGAFEGTFIPGFETDRDNIACDERIPVIDDLSQAENKTCSLLIVREEDTPAGYVKLQFVRGKEPCTNIHSDFFNCWLKPLFQSDKSGRVVLIDIIYSDRNDIPFLSRPKNKPAASLENYYDMNLDAVFCYRCKQWPTEAREWLSRPRYNGWPTTDNIDQLKLLGYFVVRKGHPYSSEAGLEWRISLTLQEQRLISYLTDVQYKCYVILKMINRDIINLKCITSYHWKTCLFYVIEESKANIWGKHHLFHCIRQCIKQMLIWVKHGFCPNYFIRRENLFDGRLTDNLRLISENKLVELLDFGFKELLRIKSGNLFEYVKSILYPDLRRRLQIERMHTCKLELYRVNAQLVTSTMNLFSRYIANNLNVIGMLWCMLDDIQYVGTISEYTTKETRSSLSLFKPLIYTSLASNISAMSIRQPNPQVRDFLLLGCYSFFMKGGLSGQLKFISVLYAAGCYTDCQWYLDQLDEEDIKNNPSVCTCYLYPRTITPMPANIDISQLKISSCLLFLPTEMSVTPDALKYEMFKDFGISTNYREKKNLNRTWFFGAVVDTNVYYFLLKFLTKKNLTSTNVSIDNYHDIQIIESLLSGSNVRHPLVA